MVSQQYSKQCRRSKFMVHMHTTKDINYNQSSSINMSANSPTHYTRTYSVSPTHHACRQIIPHVGTWSRRPWHCSTPHQTVPSPADVSHRPSSPQTDPLTQSDAGREGGGWVSVRIWLVNCSINSDGHQKGQRSKWRLRWAWPIKGLSTRPLVHDWNTCTCM